jgi:hypothetical protein
MRFLFLAFTLLTAPALAQPSFLDQYLNAPPPQLTPQPRTVPLNDGNGTPIGTVTFFGNAMILRKLDGELVATVVFEPDGSQTLYDPNGNILDKRAKPTVR